MVIYYDNLLTTNDSEALCPMHSAKRAAHSVRIVASSQESKTGAITQNFRHFSSFVGMQH